MANNGNNEPKVTRTRVTNGSSRPMYNDDAFNSDLDSPVEENNGVVMRVGKDYQAKVPDCVPEQYNSKHEALLVWQPCLQKISHAQVDEFCRTAKEQHKYSEEQALGMLFWHKHDIDKALTDLANFAPFPDEWSAEDKVLFEQAISYHGKSFHRIKEMLPDKTIAALVKFYYSWKKAKSRASEMDKSAKTGLTSDVISDLSSQSESESDSGSAKSDSNSAACTNCNAFTSNIKMTANGQLCSTCYQYWKRTGAMRPFSLFKRTTDKDKSASLMPQRYNPTKSRKRLPRGIYMHETDLKEMATGGEEKCQAILDKLNQELTSIKSQMQVNKQHISLLKGNVQGNIDEYKPDEMLQAEQSAKVNSSNSNKWTQDELMIAVQGVRFYGKNYQVISELLGTKSLSQVKSFFTVYRRKYNLDAALAEYESGKQAQNSAQSQPEKMETEDSSESSSVSNDEVASSIPSLPKSATNSPKRSQSPKMRGHSVGSPTRESLRNRASPYSKSKSVTSQ